MLNIVNKRILSLTAVPVFKSFPLKGRQLTAPAQNVNPWYLTSVMWTISPSMCVVACVRGF